MRKRRERLVLAIGLLKLVKATGLFVVGIVSFVAFPQHLALAAERATTWVGVLSSSAAVHRGIAKLASMDDGTSRKLGGLALAYGCVFLIEGVGLVLKKGWAEWLTVVVTTSFIPFEIYELVEHFGAGEVVALILNVAVVAYLAWRRFKELGHDDGRSNPEPNPAHRQPHPRALLASTLGQTWTGN